MLDSKRLNRREFLRLSAMASAGAVLAACAPGTTVPDEEPTEAVSEAPSTEAEKVALTAWMNDRLYVQSFQNRQEALSEAHPEYDITFTVEENPDLWDNLVTLFVGGLEDVDIVSIERMNMTQLWKDDLAAQSLVALNDAYLTQEQIDGNLRWEMFSSDGKIYGVSAEMDGVALYYQPALFEEAGVDVDSILSYDDFIQAGLALKALGKYIKYEGSADINKSYAMQNGGGFWNADGETLLDSPETIEAIQMQYDMLRTHEVSFETNDSWSPAAVAGYQDGTVAASISADWWGDYYLKDLLPDMEGMWKLRPLPWFEEGGIRTSTDGGTGFCIVKSSSNPALAWDFIQTTYLDKDNLVQIYLDTHYFPPMKACWDDPKVLEFSDPYYVDEQAIGAVWAELAPETPPDPTHAYYPEAADAVSKEIVLAFEGDKSVEQALQDAAATVRAAMA